MAYEVQVVDDGAGLIFMASGKLTRDDVLSSARSTRDPDAESKVRYVLVDHADGLEIDLSGVDVRDLVSENEARSATRSKRIVAVAAPNDYIYGISRMWQTLVEKIGWTVQVFRTREEALEWLKSRVPDAKFEPCDIKY